ncbi:DUF6538 domain-containing protein [Xanthomonas vasicola]|uniref:DUF6538 domain-containing protein n=1 Tax=Xanthomonas vasicola TaxID=56459 RepID=UPI000309837D
MRIPHHLIRSASGRWSFRQRVPLDLQARLGRRVIKRTLRTTELRQAQIASHQACVELCSGLQRSSGTVDGPDEH